MSAMASGLRWFGTLLVNAADELEAARTEPALAPGYGAEVEEDLRRMRERVQARGYY